ncbi:transferrin receptor-like dimerization domain-containing protein [Dyadobacter arcticus]|uniref:N-acetylated-alpha-linked acidic dipeptidase n=1 Tax=Dyadobacter arcticus TaxID=1078754 RepID=A0ABX0UQJ0_9BACT|nr:transferrin receptor-like dimerization domain-containing protein [Dyadobacter arcticus]NIJ53840.1 N-acetylated-alpha-linked acidic dipeptidase [Dyadobacter arcticus]
MRHIFRKTTSYIFFFSLALASPGQAQQLMGFSAESAKKEMDLEAAFDKQLQSKNLQEWMKLMTAYPHQLGSAYGLKNALFIKDKLTSWGFETIIDTVHVLFPTPKVRIVELTEPTKFKASLMEKPFKEDATSAQTKDVLPPYHAYSANGDVTAELVFVNYGIPDDYEELAKMGIDVKGKIVIAKYGNSWRGIKPKVAYEHGAIGCIIYSDPKEDGYFQGDVYPKGPYKNETGAQRGSVVDLPQAPGDPLTNGFYASGDKKRLTVAEAPSMMKIPVLPISYSDALPLLKALGGQVAPAAWRGALPITYHIGPGPAKVHLKLEFNFDIVPCYNVIATLKGSEFPDQWVLRGNHHDAWVFGAADPVSGAVSELEEARALGELVKTGWKLKRTIVYCWWDGEEPGLLGSTEWVEKYQDILKEKAVVYVNTDGNGRGYFGAGGSHTLEKFINQVGRDVIDPEKGTSVIDRLRSEMIVYGNPTAKQEARSRSDLRIVALGSGSDYTPFIQHLGIASLNLGFGGEDGGGDYHSIFDSYDDYIRFKDGDFAYGVALAKTCGRSILRFANAEILPFEFGNFSNTVQMYATDVKKQLETARTTAEDHNKLLSEGRFEAVADPKEPKQTIKAMVVAPYLNFAPLENALSKLEESANTFTALLDKAGSLPADKLTQLNQILYKTERYLINQEGLPKRPWYKHQIYAPGFYTGYGVKTLPMIRESIEQKNWPDAEIGITRVTEALKNFTGEIDKAVGLVK